MSGYDLTGVLPDPACGDIEGGGGGAPLVVTSYLPDGIVDTIYERTLTATGGTPPLEWSLCGGDIPGLVLTDDTVAGTPTEAGHFDVTIKVADATSTGWQDRHLVIAPATAPGAVVMVGRYDYPPATAPFVVDLVDTVTHDPLCVVVQFSTVGVPNTDLAGWTRLPNLVMGAYQVGGWYRYAQLGDPLTVALPIGAPDNTFVGLIGSFGFSGAGPGAVFGLSKWTQADNGNVPIVSHTFEDLELLEECDVFAIAICPDDEPLTSTWVDVAFGGQGQDSRTFNMWRLDAQPAGTVNPTISTLGDGLSALAALVIGIPRG